jgi:uncharacterized protein YkwD
MLLSNWHLFAAICFSGVLAITIDQQIALDKVNEARQSKGLMPLTWNYTLETDAKSWAEQNAAANAMYHCDGNQCSDSGEVIFYWWTSDINGITEVPYSKAVDAWLAEGEFYHGQVIGDPDTEKWGHYSEYQ